MEWGKLLFDKVINVAIVMEVRIVLIVNIFL